MNSGQVTVQRVSGAMRRAMLPKATWKRSGQVRGWGRWSSGVRVWSGFSSGGAFVCWQFSGWGTPSPDQVKERAEVIAKALDAAGLCYTRDGDTFHVTAVRKVTP